MRYSRRRGSNGSPKRVGAHTVIDACPEGDGALGLFASRGIPKGTVVARMNQMRAAGARLRDMYIHGRPGGDAAIHAGTELYTSSGFGPLYNGRYARAPKWYRMNHSDKPNCKLVRETEGGRLAWRTLRDIERDEALTWHYGVRDPSWPRGKGAMYCSHRPRRSGTFA